MMWEEEKQSKGRFVGEAQAEVGLGWSMSGRASCGQGKVLEQRSRGRNHPGGFEEQQGQGGRRGVRDSGSDPMGP